VRGPEVINEPLAILVNTGHSLYILHLGRKVVMASTKELLGYSGQFDQIVINVIRG
jgi:hypothetical protein